MDTLVIILALIAGFMQSLVYTLAFIKNNNDWIKSLITVGVISIMFGEAFYFKKYFPNLFKNEDAFLIFVISFFFFTTLLTFVLILLLYKHHNKKSSPIKKVSFGQFIVNPYEILKLNHNENLKNQERFLEEIKKIQKNIQNNLHENKSFSLLKIPLNYYVEVNEQFLNRYVTYIETVSKYVCYLNSETEKFLNARKHKKDEKIRIFKNYLETISYITYFYLFDSDKHDIRIHFRILNTETNNFEKYYTYENKNESHEPLTPMSADIGIIKEAIVLKRSLVKSANLDLHQNAKNDNQWKNYLTIVFSTITNNEGNQCFSMTISIHDEEIYTDLLYFLCYIQIERYVEKNLKKVIQQYKIKCEEIR